MALLVATWRARPEPLTDDPIILAAIADVEDWNASGPRILFALSVFQPGMARAVNRRLKRAEAGRRGGLRSARLRRTKYGTAQPASSKQTEASRSIASTTPAEANRSVSKHCFENTEATEAPRSDLKKEVSNTRNLQNLRSIQGETPVASGERAALKQAHFEVLFADIEAETGEEGRRSRYRRLMLAIGEGQIRRAISETRSARLAGEIRTTPGAYFEARCQAIAASLGINLPGRRAEPVPAVATSARPDG